MRRLGENAIEPEENINCLVEERDTFENSSICLAASQKSSARGAIPRAIGMPINSVLDSKT